MGLIPQVLEYFNNDKISFGITVGFILFMIYFLRKDIISSLDYSQVIFTLGILGTFFGITYGLFHFETQDIEKSIPTLLAGLKTSFITSIWGMGSVIIIELRNKNKRKELRPQSQSEYLSEIYKLLEETTSTSEKLYGFLRPGLEQLIKSIEVGNNESKKGFKSMESTLQGISKNIAEGASNALVGALEITMQDFNKNLKESFGQNFQQLNDACLEMIKWQKEYKVQINQGIENLNSINNTLVNASEAHEQIVKNSRESVQVSKKVEELIQGCNGHINVMSELLKEYGALSEGAKDMFSNLDKGFSETSKKLSNVSEEIKEHLHKQYISINNTMKEIENSLPGSLGMLNKQLTKLTEEFIEIYGKFLTSKKSET